jgi:hypothetical protein
MSDDIDDPARSDAAARIAATTGLHAQDRHLREVRAAGCAEALGALCGDDGRASLAYLRWATGAPWRRVRGPRATHAGEVRLSAQTARGRLTLDQSGARGEWILRLWPEGARGVPPVLWSAAAPVGAQEAAALLGALREMEE